MNSLTLNKLKHFKNGRNEKDSILGVNTCFGFSLRV